LDRGKGMHDPDAPGVADALLAAFDVHADDWVDLLIKILSHKIRFLK
jgi:hypothetical protein